MGFFTAIKGRIKGNRILKVVMMPVLYAFHQYRLSMVYLPAQTRRDWNKRIEDVLNCPDRKFIKLHKEAGKISDGMITLHNGIRIEKTSYYGYPILRMLIKSKGVHEPQEERVFQEVLKSLPQNSVMMELGSYWSFYSMWFQQVIRSGVSYLIEPSEGGLESGKNNMRINGMKGTFIKSFIDSKSGINELGERISAVDDLVRELSIGFIDVLHSDIQGFEHEMLQGARRLFQEKKVGYVFISTHSAELHKKCLGFLKDFDFNIIANADMDDTYSLDGLIVGRAPYYPGIDEIKISLKSSS